MKRFVGVAILLLAGCSWTGNGSALMVTPNGNFGFEIHVEKNDDGTPGTMKATFDAESFNIIGDTIDRLKADPAAESEEVKDDSDTD